MLDDYSTDLIDHTRATSAMAAARERERVKGIEDARFERLTPHSKSNCFAYKSNRAARKSY